MHYYFNCIVSNEFVQEFTEYKIAKMQITHTDSWFRNLLPIYFFIITINLIAKPIINNGTKHCLGKEPYFIQVCREGKSERMS